MKIIFTVPNLLFFKTTTVSLSNQILILAIAQLSLISVNVLCEFTILLDVCILLSPQDTTLPVGTDVHIWQHIHQKD